MTRLPPASSLHLRPCNHKGGITQDIPTVVSNEIRLLAVSDCLLDGSRSGPSHHEPTQKRSVPMITNLDSRDIPKNKPDALHRSSGTEEWHQTARVHVCIQS